MIGLEDRRYLVDMLQEAHDDGAILYKARETAGITVRTLELWPTRAAMSPTNRPSTASCARKARTPIVAAPRPYKLAAARPPM